jgi:LuxR family maltose regulon positive regulatory protein
LEANLLLAAALAGQQRLPEARELVAVSLAAAEMEEYRQIFLDIGEPVRDLLDDYLRSNAAGYRAYAQKLRDLFWRAAAADTAVSPPGKLLDPLSARELQVLQIIAKGKTNKEIARQLVIAPGTVKAHTAAIYRKLDVANRTEAVTRARSLGLLS